MMFCRLRLSAKPQAARILLGLNRHFANQHTILWGEILVHRSLEYCTRHVEALGDLAENGPIAVQPRRRRACSLSPDGATARHVAKGNVELCGGAFQAFPVAGADGHYLVALCAEFPLG